ncbi:MAG: hypothetical protein JNK87_00615 [Bryobacterales bacterium]|nr:hypothetical protein [Bryobacterales bacterium]
MQKKSLLLGPDGLCLEDGFAGADAFARQTRDMAIEVAMSGGVIIHGFVAEDERAGFVDGLEGALDFGRDDIGFDIDHGEDRALGAVMLEVGASELFDEVVLAGSLGIPEFDEGVEVMAERIFLGRSGEEVLGGEAMSEAVSGGPGLAFGSYGATGECAVSAGGLGLGGGGGTCLVRIRRG